MRTENPTVAARVGAQIQRVRRSLATRRPILRWSLPLGAVIAVLALAYLAAPLPTATQFLHSGQPFSTDDIIKITRELEARGLAYRVDERGRIEVPGDRLADVREALAKLDVGPQSIEAIQKEASESSPWEGPSGAEERYRRGREKFLAALIRRLDGIVSAYVGINRTRVRAGFHVTSNATAFVWIETERNHELGPKTVQTIENIIVGNEPDLKHDAITICDQKGRYYLIAGNATLGKMTMDRAREAEYAEKILEKLDWVRGVRVTVQIIPEPAPPPPPAPAPPVPTTEATGPAESSVGVNKPLELDPPPGPSPAPAASATSAAAKPADDHRMVRVLVSVPRSFYLKATPNREPSQDELRPIVSWTEKRIKTVIDFLVAPGEPHDVIVESILDDEPAGPPLIGTAPADVRRSIPWWVPAATAGAAMAALLFVGVRVLAMRRPESRPAPAPHLGRYKVDAPSEPGPGPSERVRELIRLNPESAASVLHRWIGQGGGSS